MPDKTISNKIKDDVWKKYTSNPSSKNELKKMFFSNKPGEAYNNISTKITKAVNKEIKDSENKSKPKSTLKPTLKPKPTSTLTLKSTSKSKK
jgi:hypothetical protein